MVSSIPVHQRPITKAKLPWSEDGKASDLWSKSTLRKDSGFFYYKYLSLMIITNEHNYNRGGAEPAEIQSERVALWKAAAVAGTMTEDITLFLL